MDELVKKCKAEYKNKNLKSAWNFWCRIYDKFEKDTKGLFTQMSFFTNDEVYDITNYGKQINGY